jgi:hypothetical protein
MTLDRDAGELLPDGSRIRETTVGALADWLQRNPLVECGCAQPQPFNLCCPARLIYPTYPKARRR